MYKIDGLTNYQRVYGQQLAEAQALPQNTTWNGDPIKLSGTHGSIEVVARVNEALTIADGQVITIKLQHADADLSYSDLGTLYTLTAAGGNGAIAKNTELGKFVLPTDTKKNVRAVIITDDPAADGKVDVIPTYLPR